MNLFKKVVTNSPGTYNVLSVSVPFSIIPNTFDPYTFGETGAEAKLFRVLSISKTQDLFFVLSCVEYNETVYDAEVDQSLVLPTPNPTRIDLLPSVTNIFLSELYIKGQDGFLLDIIDVYFKNPIVIFLLMLNFGIKKVMKNTNPVSPMGEEAVLKRLEFLIQI
jgi:hypothetical protein